MEHSGVDEKILLFAWQTRCRLENSAVSLTNIVRIRIAKQVSTSETTKRLSFVLAKTFYVSCLASFSCSQKCLQDSLYVSSRIDDSRFAAERCYLMCSANRCSCLLIATLPKASRLLIGTNFPFQFRVKPASRPQLVF